MITARFKRLRLLLVAKSPYWSYLPVGLSLFLGIGLSTVASVMVWKWERVSTQAQFERQADSLVNALQRNLDRYAQATRFLGGLYDASKTVEPEDFRLFSQNILPYDPGIKGVGWAKRITSSQRTTYEQQIASKGFPKFHIQERNAAGMLVSARSRPEYLPIAYLEPKELQPLLGYDLFSETNRRTAIERSKETGIMAIAEQVSEGSNSSTNFVIYKPVYERNSQPSSSEGLSQSFRGVVYTVFQLKDMVENSLKELEMDRLDFFLYNTSLDQLQSSLMKPSLDAREYLLLSYDRRRMQVTERSTTSPKPHSCPYDWEWFTCLRTLNIAGQEWSILILPPSELAVTQSGVLSTLAIGLAATSTLVIYLWMSIKHTTETERLVTALRQIVHQTK